MGFRNQITRPVADFTVDPNRPGVDVFRDVITRVQGFLVPAMVGGDTNPGLQFFGYAESPQEFRGVAARVTTPSVLPDGTADLADAATADPMGDPIHKIFADRLRRRIT
ncbi:MAG: hypothetical protein QM714_19500 [Nocardioides sp.]|uniref:hypothetical protein n=1 Tax=Nocardioides sp. TaxID=35761 RepID=UPI0039E6E4A8